jgi:uncharacterized SAM-binding protein YcdF (DUF218 family)
MESLDASAWRSLLSLVFYPLPFLCLLVLLSLVLRARKRFKAGKFFGILAFLWFLLTTTSPIPNYLVGRLESQYPALLKAQLEGVAGVSHILVLGAGHTDNPALPLNGQLSETEMFRLVEGIRLHQIFPNSTLVTSGAKGKKNHESQATVAGRQAVQLGVPADKIDSLTTTTNTMTEALAFKQRYGDQTRFWLVTDAVHMPRAVKWFERFGLQPIPSPTNHLIKDEPQNRDFQLLPSSKSLSKMETAMHEYLGMLWMEILDRFGKLEQYKQIN